MIQVVGHEAVCRITVYSKKINVLKPFQEAVETSAPSFGSGFLMRFHVEGAEHFFIVTCFHVIRNAVKIHVSFQTIQNGDSISAIVVGGNPHLDVAILKMEDTQNSLPVLQWGDSDEIRTSAKLMKIGFALGETGNAAAASGICSKRLGTPNRLQVDIKVNHGDSGGPLIDNDNKVVGIITSGVLSANNVNFASPAQESKQSLDKIALRWIKDEQQTAPVWDMGFDFNCCFRKMNATYLRNIKVDNGCKVEGGALIVYVNDHIESIKLKQGDILVEIMGYSIDSHMQIDAAWWKDGKLPMQTILDRLMSRSSDNILESEWIPLKILRPCNSREQESTYQELILNTKLRADCNVFRQVHAYCEPLEYVARGGVVVQMLNENILENMTTNMSACMNIWMLIQTPAFLTHSCLVVTHTCHMSPFAEEGFVGQFDVIESINGRCVSTLHEYAQIWEDCMANSDVITIAAMEGSVLSATVHDVVQFEEMEGRGIGLKQDSLVNVKVHFLH